MEEIKNGYLPTRENFQNGRIKCFLDCNFSVFDYDRTNAQYFSQGEWNLIRRDMILANVQDIKALEDGPCAEVIRAFQVRRELIHYKKICLHLYEEARIIERQLKQVMEFFFWSDGNTQEGRSLHVKAIIALTEADESISIFNLESIQEAMRGHEASNSCELYHRKIMFNLASRAWMYHRGAMKAIQDARNIVKAICLSPRHPDGEAHGERPAKLCSLPSSMMVEREVHKAEQKNPSRFSIDKKEKSDDLDKGVMDNQICTDTANENGPEKTKGSTLNNHILTNVQNQLDWTKESLHFLSISIAARGGFKALAMVEELMLYKEHLSGLQERAGNVLQRFKDTQSDAVDTFVESPNSSVSNEFLSGLVFREKEIHHLNGALKVCRENAKWVSVINSVFLNPNESDGPKKTRLFVCRNNTKSTGSFVPKGFELGYFITYARSILETILIPTMHRVLEKESWPPVLGSRRTRVLAFSHSTIENTKKQLQQCGYCSGLFGPRWIQKNVCAVCESKLRKQNNGNKCMFKQCKAGTGAYCPHHRRCFICDSPHSCDECRLTTGDGEVAMTMVEAIKPKLLILDFDGTLCSTKSGGSPLPNTTSKCRSNDGYSHSIDPDLKSAVLAQHTQIEAYVLTRNSHKADIETFLEMQDLKGLAKNVHIVPKKMTKGEYIRDTISPTQSDVMLFVDDDVRELTGSSWLRAAPNMHCLLFKRY